MTRTTRWLLAEAAVRAAWGATLTIAPRRVLASAGSPAAGSAVAVARTLGIRQLLQAGVTVLVPARAVVGYGALVDGMHAGSGVVLATVSSRWRRVALADTLIATAFAAAGVLDWYLRRAGVGGRLSAAAHRPDPRS